MRSLAACTPTVALRRSRAACSFDSGSGASLPAPSALSPVASLETLLLALRSPQRLDAAWALSLLPSEAGDDFRLSGTAAPGLALGWTPRRTRLVAPLLDRPRFDGSLSALPYRALLTAERAWIDGAPAFGPGVGEECELRVLCESADWPTSDFVFRMRRAAGGPRSGTWLVKSVAAGGWWSGRQ